MTTRPPLSTAALLGLFFVSTPITASDYPIVDTGQTVCYDASAEIAPPSAGGPFVGQDAQLDGEQPSYAQSADGLTVYDEVTGLTWMRAPDGNLDGTLESPADKMSFADAQAFPAVLNTAAYGGFDDWRLPTIKELYSLILFSGVDPSGYSGDTSGLIPFLDPVFEFVYGDESAGERVIDSQYWSATEYVGLTMGGDHTVFGVNFADGRIKGYGTSLFGTDKTSFVLCCRGNPAYGVNDFTVNDDGTVADDATGLMWMQDDGGEGLAWEDALAYADTLTLAGHDDWRLPNVKELQSIVDYTRSLQTTGGAAINPVFTCTAIVDEGGGTNYPFYWSGTTHANWTANAGSAAAYVAFGEGLGWMQDPFPPYDYTLMDVHGAGCQRSDPKEGDPADYPYGRGPQGDVIRIDNHVRCVRDADPTVGLEDPEETPEAPTRLSLATVPNPFNPSVEISFTLPKPGTVSMTVHDARGRLAASPLQATLAAGEHAANWNGLDLLGRPAPAGIYLVHLRTEEGTVAKKITLVK